MPAIDPTIEHALADVFNHQYQSFPADTPWITVMRSVARAIAAAIYPESAELRASFLDDANMAGLFTDSVAIPPIYAPSISEEVVTSAERIAAELLTSSPTYSHPREDSTPALYRVVRATMGRAPVAIIDGSAPYPLDDESISEGIVRALNARRCWR